MKRPLKEAPGSSLHLADPTVRRPGYGMSPQSGDVFPYDEPDRSRGSGRGEARAAKRSSASGETTLPIIPQDTEHTIWDDVAEAVGIPFSIALSSRAGHRTGMASVPAAPTAGEEPIDYDEIEKAGSGPWHAAETLIRALSDDGFDVVSVDDERSIVDRDDPSDIEASRSWRGLTIPEGMAYEAAGNGPKQYCVRQSDGHNEPMYHVYSDESEMRREIGDDLTDELLQDGVTSDGENMLVDPEYIMKQIDDLKKVLQQLRY